MRLFEGLTPDTILERVLGRMDTDLQTREGSYAYDQAAPIVFEIWRALMTLDELVEAFYINEHSGPYLDAHAGLFAMARRQGTRAMTETLFCGRAGVTIPEGTAFYTADGLEFRLTHATTIEDSTAVGYLQAAEVGQRYNVAAGAINQTLRNISGLESWRSRAADGGTDPEGDEALFARIDERRKRPPTSGNPNHYRQWALSVDGVGAVKVSPLWAGPGTVRVLIAGYDREPVTQAVVDACAAYIGTQRPVGADVTVASAQAVPIHVSARVVLEPGVSLAAVKAAFVSQLDAYLGELAFEEYTVYAHKVGALLIGIDGVMDYGGLTLNGSGENLKLGGDSVPTVGEVELA